MCDWKNLLHEYSEYFFFFLNQQSLFYLFSQCISPHERIWSYGNGNFLEYKGKSLFNLATEDIRMTIDMKGIIQKTKDAHLNFQVAMVDYIHLILQLLITLLNQRTFFPPRHKPVRRTEEQKLQQTCGRWKELGRRGNKLSRMKKAKSCNSSGKSQELT